MAWVKIDDQAPRHHKMLKAQPAACWLWVCGLAHCQAQLTDGFISDEVLPLIGVVNHARRLAVKLVAARLWDVVDGGYQVHDYLAFNTPKAEVLVRKDTASEQRRQAGIASGRSRRIERDVKRFDERPVERNTNGPVERPLNPIPSHPIPSEVPSELLRRGRGQPPLAMNLKRLKFWRWMAEAFIAKLGDHANEFDLDAWIHDCDDHETRVIAGDWWAYWLPAFEAEVRRRGLPLADAPQLGKASTRMAAALANIRREES